MLGLTFKSRVREVKDELAEWRKRFNNERKEKEMLQNLLRNKPFDPLPKKLGGTVYTTEETRIAWKRTRNHLVKLLIPKDTRVVYPSGSGKKLRVEEAYVVKFTGPEGEASEADSDKSIRNAQFVYEKGEFHTPDKFDPNTNHLCTNGLHVYAKQYQARGHSSWHGTPHEGYYDAN